MKCPSYFVSDPKLFFSQALCCEWIIKNYKNLEKKVNDVPREIDEKVARLKLESIGVRIDKLTTEQEKYLTSWKEGT